ncbi:hypothetical protein GCM10009718_06200 [Isoptericola halotolerans]|uniref:CHAD domain-containing protein n=1 Tax=Isoptericola halotolerans TaxID=300560 RepID=A0ABX2A0V3_9MICO|nr:CHAD domain-containing protein [Isoptericola halotolerans]NOV96458.1 CHAD domain-containing protein [Isoptericola halotolerans]
MSHPWSSSTAGELFAAVVAEHVRRTEQRVPAALSDEPDGVHRLRTAVRRLRTVLTVYRPVFGKREADALRDRLTVLGDLLGEVRDLEVRIADVDAVGAGARVSVEARRHLVDDLTRRHDAAHRRLVEWLNGPEMADLTAALVRWVADPPRGPKADDPARKVARRRLDKAVAKALRTAEDVDLERLSTASGDELEDLSAAAHRLRKAGRRVSHAARAVTRKPTRALGGTARELGAAGQRVQSTLGDHRDAFQLAAHVTAVADAVADDGGDRGPYDRLARAAARRGAEHLDTAREAVERLREVASGR